MINVIYTLIALSMVVFWISLSEDDDDEGGGKLIPVRCPESVGSLGEARHIIPMST